MSKLIGCPVCGYMYSVVNNTYGADAGLVIERRRTCTRCGTRFLTIETFDRIISPRSNRKNQPKINVKQEELFK